jgi:hypothetical protein
MIYSTHSIGNKKKYYIWITFSKKRMATLADKILVVYIERESQEVEQNETKETSLKGSSFDTIVKAGCSGFLTLPGQQTRSLEILEAILCLHKKDSKQVLVFP